MLLFAQEKILPFGNILAPFMNIIRALVEVSARKHVW
jgi:hypothetical protein